jgi:hypothetical protein
MSDILSTLLTGAALTNYAPTFVTLCGLAKSTARTTELHADKVNGLENKSFSEDIVGFSTTFNLDLYTHCSERFLFWRGKSSIIPSNIVIYNIDS